MGSVMLIIQIIISIVLPIWLSLWFAKHVKKTLLNKSNLANSIPDTQFLIKRWWAEWCVSKRLGRKSPSGCEQVYRSIKYVPPQPEAPRTVKTDDGSNSMLFFGADQKGNSLFIKFALKSRRIVEVILQFVTEDKRVYVLPDYPNTIVSGNPNYKWSAVGLKIEQIQAQRRWRITYNGLLLNLTRGNSPSDRTLEHVRLNCIFVANARPLEWPGDWSTKLHADAIAHEPWRSPQWINKIELLDYTGLDQFGSIFGQVTFEDSTVSNLYLRGMRQPRWGKHESHEFHKAVIFLGTMSNGSLFYVGAASTKSSFDRMQFGHLKHSDERLWPVDSTSIELPCFGEDDCFVNTRRSIRFAADHREYDVIAKFKHTRTFYTGRTLNWAVQLVSLDLEMTNGQTGVGLMQLWYPDDGSCHAKPHVSRLDYLKHPATRVKENDYIVFLEEEKCKNETLVGGKGYSLAILTSVKNGNFTVPEGFCVTTMAFDFQLQSSHQVQSAVNDVAAAAASISEDKNDLQVRCEEAMRIIESTPIVDPVREAILKATEKLESSDVSISKRYAVRSSAVGEDGEETSAAGQNSTFLGVQGTEDLMNGITKCWASLYSFQSVEYRRQRGLSVKASMGICIQRMVNAEAAGVMFTRHPTTGNPSDIIITANYGLGESVVSAMVEPDTITVHRDQDDKLIVKSSAVGQKTRKILIGDDGVIVSNLEEEESRRVAVSERVALQLASIGIDLEKLFGSGRDVEWAVAMDEIFLLQARPITTLNTWTEFELTHELDTTVPSNIDIISFANVGEVFPNAVSPLSISVVVPFFNDVIRFHHNHMDLTFLSTTAMRCTINYYHTLLLPEEDISIMKKISDVALCGRVMLTPEIHKIAVERNGPSTGSQRFYQLGRLLKDVWDNSAIEQSAQSFKRRFHCDTQNCHRASSLFARIDSKFTEMSEIVNYHLHTSRVSIMYQIIAMSLLMKGYDDLTPDHFRDIAILLSSCTDVVSTEIPIRLGRIAGSIKNSGKAQEFGALKPSETIPWLKENCPVAAAQVDDLFEKHGYRCIQELDLMAEPWSFKPETLMETIQTLAVSPGEPNEAKMLSVEETVSRLKTPKTKIIRRILKTLVPFCRKAVARREYTKSVLVNAIHLLRLAYRKLARFMVRESYLPDERLIFFLTHQEIGDLLSSRCSALVQKAHRRRRLHPRLSEVQYPEVNIGLPVPLRVVDDVTIRDGSPKIQATPVCGGSILGRACVITKLSEAKEIKSGDILITHATDIGWSPYFPLLGGIVTELGGLISHGAVVAREYGLPCIIDAKGAMKMFHTGDTVLLVGDTGVLQLIQRV